jgi:hypothetical protein
MRIANFFLIIIIFTGCRMINNETSDEEIIISMNQSLESEDELKKSVIFEGDTKAYRSLSIAYLDYSYSEELLLYALIMANKYDHPQAYFDVFKCLIGVYFNELTKIDKTTANIAINYLIIASEKDHKQAKEIVKRYSINRQVDCQEQILKIYNTNN